MKKILCVILSAVMLLACLAACGGNEEPAPAKEPAASEPAAEPAAPAEEPAAEPEAPAEEPAEEPEAPAELVYTGPELELTFSLASSEEQMAIYRDCCNRITERTDNKVTFVIYYSGSLLSAQEALDGLGTGMCDIADITLTNNADRFVYSQQVTSYPFLGFTSFPMAADVMSDFIPSSELCMAEFDAANIHPLFFTGVWGTALVMADDVDISTPDTLKGKKIISSNAIENEFLLSCGATPVAQPVTEFYSSMSNGVVDGIMNGLYVTNIFGALALAKSVYMFERSFTTGCRAFCINKDTWDSFDDTLKQIFVEEWQGDELWNAGVNFWAASDQSHLDDCKEWNIPVTWIEGDLMQQWADAAQPYGDAKLQELYDQGYTEVFNVLEDLEAAIAAYDGGY